MGSGGLVVVLFFFPFNFFIFIGVVHLFIFLQEMKRVF